MALLPLIFLIAAFAFGLAFRWRMQRPVTEPSCGHCRYCVTGLETTTCPECGSDLRVVGILTPGTTPALGKGWRVLGWTLFAPLITMMIGGVVAPFVAPYWVNTTHRRVIFSQAPYCNVTLTANAVGKKLVWGSGRGGAGAASAPIESIFLSAAPSNASMQISLPARQFQYLAANKKSITGSFDALATEKWLNDLGFTDPRVADAASAICQAVNEMQTPAGAGFTQFPLGAGQTLAPGVAHPTFTFSVTQPNELAYIALGLLFILIWIAGLPLALRRPPASPGKAQPSESPYSPAPPATT